MRGRRTAPELRAKAEALLLAGSTQGAVCKETGLSKATVSALFAGLGSDKIELVRTQKIESDGELILRFLRTTLRSMIAQAEVMGREDWIFRQDGDKVGIAFGIMGDKFAGVAATAAALGIPLGTPALPEPDSDD